MDLQKFKEKPMVFKILQVACLLLAADAIFSLFRNIKYSADISGSLISIVLWCCVSVGFYMTKKWAWALYFTLLSFGILKTVYSLLIQATEFSLSRLVFISMILLIIWSLNIKTIRDLFKIDWKNDQQIPLGIRSFAVICLSVGLFFFVDTLGISRIAGISVPSKLFIGSLGLIYVLLGLGIWQLNKFAFQAVHAILIFSLLATLIVVVYGFFQTKRFLAMQNSLLCISISIGMLFYWVRYLRIKIPNNHFD